MKYLSIPSGKSSNDTATRVNANSTHPRLCFCPLSSRCSKHAAPPPNKPARSLTPLSSSLAFLSPQPAPPHIEEPLQPTPCSRSDILTTIIQSYFYSELAIAMALDLPLLPHVLPARRYKKVFGRRAHVLRRGEQREAEREKRGEEGNEEKQGVRQRVRLHRVEGME